MMDGGDGYDDFDDGQDEDKMMDGGQVAEKRSTPTFVLWSKPKLSSFLQMNLGTEQ